jgi:hypothetical protein
MGDGQSDLVRIAVAPNEAVAAIWRELLRAEGVPVLVRVGGPGLAYFAPALCEHHLHVRADQAARARQLLDDYRATPDEVVAPGDAVGEPSPDEEG